MRMSTTNIKINMDWDDVYRDHRFSENPLVREIVEKADDTLNEHEARCVNDTFIHECGCTNVAEFFDTIVKLMVVSDALDVNLGELSETVKLLKTESDFRKLFKP